MKADAPETFNIAKVEAVTGVKSATIRKWDERGFYVCELRRKAELERCIIQMPDLPGRVEAAENIIAEYSQGWRRYVIADLLRIIIVSRLLELGIGGAEAGRAAVGTDIAEAKNSQPSGRELLRMLAEAPDGDELVVFSPDGPPLSKYFIGGVGRFRLDENNLRRIVPILTEATASGPAVVFNLSAIRREVLTKLEALERGE